jgi:hypothetical protein
MSKFKEIEIDTDLEKVFRATDTLVAHLSKELGRTEDECIMAMVTWLEERQKTQYCAITIPKTDKTIAAAIVLEDIGIIFDTYGTTDNDPHTFLAVLELYDGNREPVKQIHDAIAGALGDDEYLMELFEVRMDSCAEEFNSELPFNMVH